MPDIFGLLGKLFSNEPLERLMYMFIISFATLCLMPNEYIQAFNEKTGIPYGYHIFSFAVSFVLVINTQRVCRTLRYNFPYLIAMRKDKAINKRIDSLSNEQKSIITKALSIQSPTVTTNRNIPAIIELVEMGVLIPYPGPGLSAGNDYAVLKISDIYWRYLNFRWDAYSEQLKKKGCY